MKKNWRNFCLEEKKSSAATSPNYSGTKKCSEEDKGSFFHKDPHGEYQGDKLHQERDHFDIRNKFFLEWEQPFMGSTSPEMWCGPYQRRFSRGDRTGCWMNSRKVGPNLSFKVTSSPGCWFCELLEGVSHLHWWWGESRESHLGKGKLELSVHAHFWFIVGHFLKVQWETDAEREEPNTP